MDEVAMQGMPTRGGGFVRYNLGCELFELPAKYGPPFVYLGSGSSSSVWSGMNSQTNQRVVIKRIGEDSAPVRRTLREIKILRHMKHANIIAIRDVIRHSDEDDCTVYIVYDFIDNDLHQRMHFNQPIEDIHCQKLLYQLLCGLRYIHSAKVLHRDLKPRNLLVSDQNDLKIGDFGLARRIFETGSMTKRIASLWYRAPEVLLKSSEYDFAVDIWSVGCIFGEIREGKIIFEGTNEDHQLELITQLLGSPDDASLDTLKSESAHEQMRQFPHYHKQNFSDRFPNMSPLAIDLLEKMLVFDPSKRITAEAALSHEYLAAFHGTGDESVCEEPLSLDQVDPSSDYEQIKKLIEKEALDFNPDFY